jgi:hypothetical protein
MAAQPHQHRLQNILECAILRCGIRHINFQTRTQRKIMTSVTHNDIEPARKPVPTRRHPLPAGAGGDPLVDTAARLLSIPLRQLYAALWRLGLLEVRA